MSLVGVLREGGASGREGNKIYGVVVGIVRDIKDPGNLGRVKVDFPWLGEAREAVAISSSDDRAHSYWARIATLMAGKKRGSFFIPEVGDEVAYSDGDSQRKRSGARSFALRPNQTSRSAAAPPASPVTTFSTVHLGGTGLAPTASAALPLLIIGSMNTTASAKLRLTEGCDERLTKSRSWGTLGSLGWQYVSSAGFPTATSLASAARTFISVPLDGDGGFSYVLLPRRCGRRMELCILHSAFKCGGVAQLVRALPCHGRGYGFEPRRSRHLFQPFLKILLAPGLWLWGNSRRIGSTSGLTVPQRGVERPD